MEVLTTAGSVFWRLVSPLPGILFRRKFSPRWLAEHTGIDVRPRHEPVRLETREQPELQVWLVITNRGYFDIELDRLTADLGYGSALMRLGYFRRTRIASGQSADVFLRGVITRDQATHVKTVEHPTIHLQVLAEFNCKVHNFSSDTGQLSGVQVAIY